MTPEDLSSCGTLVDWLVVNARTQWQVAEGPPFFWRLKSLDILMDGDYLILNIFIFNCKRNTCSLHTTYVNDYLWPKTTRNTPILKVRFIDFAVAREAAENHSSKRVLQGLVRIGCVGYFGQGSRMCGLGGSGRRGILDYITSFYLQRQKNRVG